MDNKEYLLEWKRFFTAVIMLYKLRPSLSEDDFVIKRSGMEDWRERLFAHPVGQSGDVAVRNRLLKQRQYLLGCLYEKAAEPTNNRAER